MRNVEFAEGECYHVYNRGVERRTIFTAKADYLRFLRTLSVCRSPRPAANVIRRPLMRDRVPRYASPADPLVEILAFCLMANHYHLLLRQLVADGIARFMQKVNTAYTMYFNTKYDHDGVLLQGPYQARHVGTDSYLLPLSRYLHLNPLDVVEPRWREARWRHPDAARKFLLSYPWSSLGEYVGQPRFPGLVSTELLAAIFGSPDRYWRYVARDWSPQAFRALANPAFE